MIEHFRHAESIFFVQAKRGLPTPRDLLWILITDAVRTAQHMPDLDRAAVSRVGSAMPAARDTESDAHQRQLSRLMDGMPEYDATGVRVVVHETDVDRMVDILDLLRFVVGGHNGRDVLRMKRCVVARAAGLTIEQCGRVYDKHRQGFDRRAMWDIRTRVLGQILAGIEREFGLVRTSRSFRRLTVREIEQRAKARKHREAEANAE
ncbi:hypothetical protein C7441_11079 [Pseudaminobacter salicylatoxidans]|uniref:Uncharacterized protein n=1 Tax=Pseudaminobacter salicylatoxidans TaxID=93369 RepID=A0A316C2G9_PSESE|nr:hypothetical protein [Pseudaminobacter salicylatoxidans]PWJ81547.1 hypothetical protein C7441_11079 [Pseudaminobacter salicylatoxidans]